MLLYTTLAVNKQHNKMFRVKSRITIGERKDSHAGDDEIKQYFVHAFLSKCKEEIFFRVSSPGGVGKREAYHIAS